MILKDKKLVSTQDFKVLENILHWVSLVEENLFHFTEKGDPSLPESVVIALDNSEVPKWLDFHFAQKWITFLDILIEKLTTMSNTPNSTLGADLLQKIEMLQKLATRITLIVLYEADKFSQTQKLSQQSEQFVQLQNLVESEKARVRESMVQFIKKKTSERQAHSNEMKSLIKNYLERLKKPISQAYNKKDTSAILYILYLLRQSMKISEQCSGVGKEMTFEYFVKHSSLLTPTQNEKHVVGSKQRVDYFMKHLSENNTDFCYHTHLKELLWNVSNFFYFFFTFNMN